MTKPLFTQLTREHAIKLFQTSWENRETEIKQLFIFLKEDGTNYSEMAAYELLKDLAPYEARYNNYFLYSQDPAPRCVAECYRLMFNAYDDTLRGIIGYKYEIETWDDPLGEVDSSCTAYDETEAWDEYNTLVADGYNVRLLKIDLLKEDEDFCNACEVVAANF